MKRRTWWYIRSPEHFEVASCDCGNAHTQWSEFEDHLWCEKCEKDFKPEHWGIFDGPIPLGASKIMGICFDRYNTETGRVESFDHETIEWR